MANVVSPDYSHNTNSYYIENPVTKKNPLLILIIAYIFKKVFHAEPKFANMAE